VETGRSTNPLADAIVLLEEGRAGAAGAGIRAARAGKWRCLYSIVVADGGLAIIDHRHDQQRLAPEPEWMHLTAGNGLGGAAS